MIARAATILAAACLCAAPVVAAAHRYGPPPAHTGGFGEPTCHECHFDSELNDGEGSLAIRGFPATYAAGESYSIEVLLVRPGMELGGFQLGIRWSDGPRRGSRAGTLARTAKGVTVVDSAGVSYAQHVIEGTFPTSPDTIRWRLTWTAPPQASGRVTLNAAANATNGDDSPFGDHVYTLEHTASPDSVNRRQPNR